MKTAKRILIAIAVSAALPGCFLDGKRSEEVEPIEYDPGITAGDSNVDRTLSITTFDQVLDSMSSLTGTAPSTTTLSYMALNRSSFALQGKTSEITSGMWMAVTTLAGHVCDDLYVQERAKAASDRIYYRALNLTTGGTNSRANLDNARSRLVTGIWGRAPFSDETGFFDTSLTTAGLAGATLNATQTRNALLILCTGTLASLSAVAR